MRESICFVVFKFFLLCLGSYGRIRSWGSCVGCERGVKDM